MGVFGIGPLKDWFLEQLGTPPEPIPLCTCEHDHYEIEAASTPWHRAGCPYGAYVEAGGDTRTVRNQFVVEDKCRD